MKIFNLTYLNTSDFWNSKPTHHNNDNNKTNQQQQQKIKQKQKQTKQNKTKHKHKQKLFAAGTNHIAQRFPLKSHYFLKYFFHKQY